MIKPSVATEKATNSPNQYLFIFHYPIFFSSFLAGLCYYYNLMIPGPYISNITGISSAQSCHLECQSNQSCGLFVFDINSGNCSFVDSDPMKRKRAVNVISGPSNC